MIKCGSNDFDFDFFPDRQCEKFQFMQRNPTNKKGVALYAFSLFIYFTLLYSSSIVRGTGGFARFVKLLFSRQFDF